jgi:hypothetical protein
MDENDAAPQHCTKVLYKKMNRRRESEDRCKEGDEESKK